MNVSVQELERLPIFYEGQHTRIYYQEQSEYGAPALIKILKSEYPTPQQVVRFSNEFTLTRELAFPGIRKAHSYGMIGKRHALILRYIDGQPLKTAIQNSQQTLAEQLDIAVSVAEALNEIHKKHVIHKDINSRNILITSEAPGTTIIDFGIASQVGLKTHHLGNPETLEGTLQYISPEQTGRMNRIVDYRTDLYSLGVTLYELFTGRLPFETRDIMELVHCHIAKRPVPPCDVEAHGRASLPHMISDIIMKLLEKNAEDRYQSAYGVKVDLEKCLAQVSAVPFQDGPIDIRPFQLARDDISGRFQIPQKLYGRDREIAILLEAFERISEVPAKHSTPQALKHSNSKNQIELMLVAGYSGVGKSSLVHEIHKPITAKRGYFIGGKFGQYQRNIPYSALQQAFDEFAAYLLTESDKRLKQWKTRILKAVGKNGQLLLDIVPKFEFILGPQPDVPEIAPQEAQNRFHTVLQNFVAAIAGPEHPLVLFLDDMQWADSASLNLLKSLLTDPDIRHCLIVCAYRDNEVDAAHPFTLAVHDSKKEGAAVKTLQVENLSTDHVSALIADTFHATTDAVLSLSALIYQKTYGNAFFSTRLLQALFEEDLIHFDHTQRRWRWDVELIRAKGVTDNVADLMEQKLTRLAPETLTALKLASCIGNQFDLAILATILEQTPQRALKQIWEALREGLLVPLDENYKLVEMGESHALFRFLHDRVQQGAYALIEDASREAIHLKIGQLLLESIGQEELDEHLFDIVRQFNLGFSLLNVQQKALVQDLNIKAGVKAKASAAYAAAAEFFQQAAACLASDGWDAKYETTLELYLEWAETAYMSTRYQQAETLFDTILQHARSVRDTVRVYQMMVVYYNQQLKLREAVNLGIRALREMGIDFPDPEAIDQEMTMRQFLRFQRNLPEGGIAEIVRLPANTDPDKIQALGLLSSVATPFWTTYPNATAYELLESANLTLESGICPPSVSCFLPLGSTLSIGFGQYDMGYELGHTALQIQEQSDDTYFTCMVKFVFYNMVHYWKTPLKSGLVPFIQAYRDGIETGSNQWASYCINHYCTRHILVGIELGRTKQVCEQYATALQKLKQEDASLFFNILTQLIDNLSGDAEEPRKLVGRAFNEDEMLPQFFQIKYYTGIGFAYFGKLLLLCLLDEFSEALPIVREHREVLASSNPGQFQTFVTLFLSGMTLLQMCGSMPDDERQQALEQAAAIQEQFDTWAETCPANFAAMAFLLSAERARVDGDAMSAMTLYDRAIQAAGEQEFLHLDAFANECAAKFYLAKGTGKVAQVYMQEAYHAYRRWGFVPKVAQLEERYPKWFGETGGTAAQRIPGENMPITTTFAPRGGAALLDMGTMIKASQTLSQEMRLELVLQRLMELAVENAGAQNGVLLLKDNEQWQIQAQLTPENTVQVLQGIPLNILGGDPSCPLSVAIVEYAVRTGESVVLPNAAQDERFGRDHYVQRKQPKSVLCQTIFHKGVQIGILYLENNLSINAFTPDRLELLNILCSQAAISLENARLVESMREQERLQKEMELARQIQTAILPKRIEHPDFEIEAAMLPAEEVGGDYYDGLIGKDGNLWLGIGDVSGHGMTPGLIMMMAQTIHTAITTQSDVTPREVIVSLNNVLYRNVRNRLNADHFMTFTTLRYLGEGRFQFAGAHLTMLLYRQARGVCEQIDTEGAFLNFIPDISHAVKNAEFTIDIGDTLVLYTDGLTEAHKPDGKILDLHRFAEIVERHAVKAPDAMRDAILEDVLVWSGQHRLDDMTLMIVRRMR